MGQSELAPHDFRGKFQREYFARLAGKGFLIRAGRGRYTLYHPLFREFLRQDRKSTRLNSSHGYISYAVFCLKKKNTCNTQMNCNPLVCWTSSTIQFGLDSTC